MLFEKKDLEIAEEHRMNLGFIAHNSKKRLIEDFCIAYKGILMRHEVYATGVTGRRIEDAAMIRVHKFLPGSLGGDEQFMDMIRRGDMDLVFVFYNDALVAGSEPDIEPVIRLCDRFNIPVATNIATAESLILGLDHGDLDWRELYNNRE